MALAPRWLYAEIAAHHGIFRVGQQPATWGSGLLFNSGDERLAFGDPRGGTIVERVSWKGRPLGSRSHFELLVASDLVFADARTRLSDGDIAVQGMVGASYVTSAHRRIGLLVLGQERKPNAADRGPHLGKPVERTATFDVAGSWNFQVPGQSTHVFAETEFAQVVGVNRLVHPILVASAAEERRKCPHVCADQVDELRRGFCFPSADATSVQALGEEVWLR